jgi:elongation factor G
MPSVLLVPLRPLSFADAERLAYAVSRLKEDPHLEFWTDELSGEVTIGATGELQLEIATWRLAHEFGVRAGVGRPRVAYKAELLRSVEGEAKYINSVAGADRYAHVRLILWPARSGPPYTFENNTTGKTIPGEFIASIEAGITDALATRAIGAHPLVRVRVELVDGSSQPIASTNEAFRAAAALAVIDAASRAETIVVEPVMLLSVTSPKEFAAEVTADLTARHGIVHSIDHQEFTCSILASVAAAELFGYYVDLSALTFSRASWTQRFTHYRPRVADGDDLDRSSHVGAPLKPKSPLRSSYIMLPEPMELESEDEDVPGPRFNW